MWFLFEGGTISILGKLFGDKKDKVELVEEGYVVERIPPDAEIVERYWVKKPFARVTIAKIPELGGAFKYFIEEIPLAKNEKRALDKIIDIVVSELDPTRFSEGIEDLRSALIKEVESLLTKYEKKFRIYGSASKKRLLYYIERELIGFGPLDVLMNDVEIEDISCDGVNTPVFIWHRRYESIPTNLKFIDRKFLDDFIVKLAHRAGKHVSSAFPIVDAMIYGKHRLAASFREEVSPKGSTFTIRKFREEPFSIVDLLALGTISPEMAAYFWVLMEGKTSMLVIGGTGTGKTTLLNAIATLIKPGYKVVTIEETAEINLPIENWVQFISRESYGLSGVDVGRITLFDLVKTSLRYRPDFLIVGEVRGEEAFVLFQAVATGHGGLCTIHGESLDAAIKRLTSPPMNVSENYIPLMNVAVQIERVMLSQEKSKTPFGRRVTHVWEIRDFDDYIPIFEWSPAEDTFYGELNNSILLPRLAAKLGVSVDKIFEEIRIRAKLMRWLLDNNIRHFKEVFKYINEYYSNRDKILELIGEEVTIGIPKMSIEEAEERRRGILQVVPIKLPGDSALELLLPQIKMFLEIVARNKLPCREDRLKKKIMKRLKLTEEDYEKLKMLLQKNRLIKVEEKRKYTYITLMRKGRKVLLRLAKRL